MADLNQFIKEYSNYISTFKETSFDDNNNSYLCKDESQNVINFDKILESKYPDSNKRPKSFDALYCFNNLIFCIEFKNQKPSQINNQEVQDKLKSGKDELVKLFQSLNIQAKEFKFIYCVVYKRCIEPKDRYKCGVEKNKVLFGLDVYQEQGFIEKIYTQSVDFFTREFKKQFKKELTC
ncbi:MAG: hypothetical protein FNT15_07815 [Sulfurovum sp.]|nr:MAG: hypothetical protein FNT15_07815 [Sulfurovum sp.]